MSYLIGNGNQAAVIDAALEPSVYLHLAEAQGWHITAVFDTHIHAEHVSRSRLLAQEAGARLYLPTQQRVTLPFLPVTDGDIFALEHAELHALHTPGHTPESTTYLLDTAALFTGDTLFLMPLDDQI